MDEIINERIISSFNSATAPPQNFLLNIHSLSLNHLLTKSEELTEKKLELASVATALAN